MTLSSCNAHKFWRDPALPFLEARAIDDGRAVCYATHSHETFSIGLVTGGKSEYCIQGQRHVVTPGTVVLMNPEVAHSCNPLDGLPWSYKMLFVDVAWLQKVQGGERFIPYGQPLSRDAALYARLAELFVLLFDEDVDRGEKERATHAFFLALSRQFATQDSDEPSLNMRLNRAADLITAHCTGRLSLKEVSAAAGLSPSYLVRAFKERFGMTPHAYQLNRRVQYGRRQLRDGSPIVAVALDAGFADQAHFQRVFKQHVATTPRRYIKGSP
jgi:AraC-like DNA-binding protein